MKRKTNFKLIWVFVLAFLYAAYDAFNSASTGNDNTDRGTVYLFLIALVVSLALFVFNKTKIYGNGVAFAIFIFAIYYIIDVYIIKGYNTWGAFTNLGLTVWWILTLLFIAETTRNSAESYIVIRNFARMMFVFYAIIIIYGSINIANNTSVEFARVGYIYHLLAIFPILLLEQDKKTKNIFILAAIFLTIFSLKRGAIIILPIMMLSYYMTEKKTGNSRSNISRLFLVFIALIIIWFILDKYTGGELSKRFTSEELASGSGRAEIWDKIIKNLSKRNLLQLLFGIRNSSETTLTAGAHNEWLGTLNSYGIIGLIIFISMILALIKVGKKLVRKKSILAPAYIAMIVFVLGVCTVSGFLFVHSTFYIMIFISIAENLSFYEEQKLKKLLYSSKAVKKG